MIVSPEYRGAGVARRIKQHVFRLARKLYPYAKVFSITTGLAIMRMNTQLGFAPVTYDQLPDDASFWQGCRSCVNYDVLEGKQFRNCFCTAMLFDPASSRPATLS